MHIEFCVSTHPLGTVCVCLRSIAILPLLLSFKLVCYLKLETEDQLNWKYGVYRIICREQRFSSFEMSSGGHVGYSFIPRRNEEAATLAAFEQRVKLFVFLTKEERYLSRPRLSPLLTQKETQFDMSEATWLIYSWKQLMEQVLR